MALIGAGPGGYVAAIRAAQMGAEISLIEKSKVGGTCLNYGCTPSKILKRTADLFEEIKKAAEFGIKNCSTPHCNMVSLIARKEKVVSAQAGGILALLKRHRVNYITGNAYIQAPYRLEVTTSDSSTSTHQWNNLILATGS